MALLRHLHQTLPSFLRRSLSSSSSSPSSSPSSPSSSSLSSSPLSLATFPTLLSSRSPFAISPSASPLFSAEDFLLQEDFLSASEHDSLVAEVSQRLRKQKYEATHIDSVISGYRELAIAQWGNPANQYVVDRVISVFAGTGLRFLPVHALDLSEDGRIGAHVDNVGYSGGIIAGISLLSEAVMRLEHEKVKGAVVEVLIKPRSLYIQRRTCRYDFAHSILGPNEKPLLLPEGIAHKKRRISLMFRDEFTEKPNQ